MSYGLNAPVLVLNRHYQPVRVTRARRALLLVYAGAARALDAACEAHDFQAWRRVSVDGEESIGTSSGPIRIPRVVLLQHYGRVPLSTMRLSRRNVYLRDDYTCQYCGRREASRDLNLDHVLPRSRGGRATWENLVTSCKRCNLRKGSATPEAAGMPLLKVPRRPPWRVAASLEALPRRFREWEPFVQDAAAE